MPSKFSLPLFLALAIAATAAGCGGPKATTPATGTGPAPVAQVPAIIPPRGVDVNGQAVLLPPRSAPALSRQQAIMAARQYDNAPSLLPQVQAVLTDFTDPNSIPPPGDTGSFKAVEGVPAWVVTFTSPTPVNVSQAPGVSLYVTHANVVIQAADGSFVRGFFTK